MDRGSQGQIWGSDYLKIIVQMNKIRFKESKGDPGTSTFFLMIINCPTDSIPGNRLHVLFHICGVLIQHHALFRKFLEQGPTCVGWQSSMLADFVSVKGKAEMQVLGLLGKVPTSSYGCP